MIPNKAKEIFHKIKVSKYCLFNFTFKFLYIAIVQNSKQYKNGYRQKLHFHPSLVLPDLHPFPMNDHLSQFLLCSSSIRGITNIFYFLLFLTQKVLYYAHCSSSSFLYYLYIMGIFLNKNIESLPNAQSFSVVMCWNLISILCWTLGFFLIS